MKILLTGATGFIGRAILAKALDRGHCVASLVAPGRTAPDAGDATGRHRVLRGTLADAPWREIEAFGAETCVHSAWITTPGVYLESPENLRLLDWSRAFLARFLQGGGGHVLGVGTCIEYELNGRVLSEATTPVLPTTRYAQCKDRLRLALEECVRETGGSVGWARVFYPYGPGEHADRLCSQLIGRMHRGEPTSLATPDSVKDYLYIDDVAEAFITLVERQATGTYNVGSGEPTTVRRIADLLADRLSAPRATSAPVAARQPSDFVVADVSRLRALGWRPRVTLPDGLDRLIAAWESVHLSPAAGAAHPSFQ